MKWLITGGCGFLGTNLIRTLLNEGGHSIRVVDNLSVGSRDDLGSVCSFEEVTPPAGWSSDGKVQLIVGNIMDDQLTVQAVSGADVIVHFAANTGVGPSVENPRMDCLNNVVGTFNYLEAARACNVKRFIFASSGAPVGECEPPIHEEKVPHPVSPYGASKLAGEAYCSAYFRTYGVETVALRFGNVYGPGSRHKSSVVAKFIRTVFAGGTLEIYGDGKQTRDFIYIDDLVDAVRKAAMVPAIGGEIFQIATNRETTVGELTDALVGVLEEAGYPRPDIRKTTPRLGDVVRNYSDTSKARARLGWTPQTGLAEGLRRTVDALRRDMQTH
jgi:UDP-glucose 4-epimerase